MNTFQAVKQLKFLLQKRAWTDSPSGNVFATVLVSQGSNEEAVSTVNFPIAIIRVMESSSDPQSVGLKTQRLDVTIAVKSVGDRLGEFAMIGGQRASVGTSQGRGLLEVEEELRNVVDFLNQNNGVHVFEVAVSGGGAEYIQDVGYVASRSYTLDAFLTTGRVYPIPNGSNALTSSTVVTTSTAVSLSWAAPIERYDYHAAVSVPVLAAVGGQILVRKAGSSAPTSYSDGTNITITGSVFGTAASDTLANGAGAYTYGLFSKFDEFGNGSLYRYSSPATVTVTV